jgi:hypothetical protein
MCFLMLATVLRLQCHLGLMTGVRGLVPALLTLGLYFIEQRRPLLAGVAWQVWRLSRPC